MHMTLFRIRPLEMGFLRYTSESSGTPHRPQEAEYAATLVEAGLLKPIGDGFVPTDLASDSWRWLIETLSKGSSATPLTCRPRVSGRSGGRPEWSAWPVRSMPDWSRRRFGTEGALFLRSRTKNPAR
jgi:hypothetical protein